MTSGRRRIGVGQKFSRDGEMFEIVEVRARVGAVEAMAVDLRDADQAILISLHEVMYSPRCQLLNDGLEVESEAIDDPVELRWSAATEVLRREARVKAAHIRELRTGYQSGSAEVALPGEPRASYRPKLPMGQRVAAKARELGIGRRTLYSWMEKYDKNGEAGLISKRAVAPGLGSRQDQRWWDTAREVKGEYIEKSKPTKSSVIAHTSARVEARYGGEVQLPSYATADRIMNCLEDTEPLFRGSTKLVRDIAGRPLGEYGKLLPTRPGEYLLMDTTRLDVYAMDPQTIKWVGLDLTVAMDWYSRCIVGLLLTPTTRAIDAGAVLYEAFRPKVAEDDWPEGAVWPPHGVPRQVMIESKHLDPAGLFAATPAIVPDTLVVDHGKIYVGNHVHGVCQSNGISIAPVRLGEGRDKGPVERFFRTIRTGFLQELPGYKGPDLYSRGINPEKDAFYFIDEMEVRLREWIATKYHHGPHRGVGEPGLWAMEFSPAKMFEHGVARAGYLEAPRNPSLAYEFLPVEWRTIQPAGIQYNNRMYSGPVLESYHPGEKSPYKHRKGQWPIHVNPDDVRTVYFFDCKSTHQWIPLEWNLTEALEMAMAEDGLKFARGMVLTEYGRVDDELSLAALLERRQLGQAYTSEERKVALRYSRAQSSMAADLEKADRARAELAQAKAALTSTAADPAAEAFKDELDEEEEVYGGDDFDDIDWKDIRYLEEL
ncbi:helix-turn-helix domain-containing protein [Mycolicibacterium peregrinum]|uniref:Transposase n=1 Tax=Mycolicibacterium peregrinum TaxID=43304 RepID=A0A4Z0HXQ2_MYCPR|nr:helix-turn-helix domain-containing protein [Mycolicibacterium peregrinum]TGB45485.1 transposase [Mycolicibacterium peregrinum]TGB47785.1 transposase [Mycolicibacterium peregrinum]